VKPVLDIELGIGVRMPDEVHFFDLLGIGEQRIRLSNLAAAVMGKKKIKKAQG
jgi:hypothetical protein